MSQLNVMDAKTIASEEDYLQIRRPNKLFDNPLKKNLALLLDVLGFNFYVRNPKDTKFQMAWVDLEREYGINTRNHEHIKEKLQELENMNYISNLKTWNNGFSYKFEKTFVSLEEWTKPLTWTFLNFTLMKQLNTVSYTLYTLAYKYYDFTYKKRIIAPWKNQTKTLNIEEFRKMFNSHSQNNVQYSKNRLLTLVRKAVMDLDLNYGLKIEIYLKKFGRPIIGVRFKFISIPKLKKIGSKFAYEVLRKTKHFVRKMKEKYIPEENWFLIAQEKQKKENAELRVIAQKHTLKKFFEERLFPNIMKADDPKSQLKTTKQHIMKKYYSKANEEFSMTLDEAGSVYAQYFQVDTRGTSELNSFEKLLNLGAFGDITLPTRVNDGKIEYFVKGVHPTLANISGNVTVIIKGHRSM